MCGIVGYIGNQQAAPLLLQGLQRLEYRGYDSSGLAVIGTDGDLTVTKSVGKLTSLLASFSNGMPPGCVGIGHTRWATHGKPTEFNAHPHLDCTGDTIVIQNGIVENYLAIKERLMSNGHTFISQTDTEVLPHLIEEYLAESETLEEAVRKAAKDIEGSNAIVVLSKREPNKLIVLRIGNAGGVTVGYGDGEMHLASDLPAILPYTRTVAFLESKEMAVITATSADYSTLDGRPLKKTPQVIPYDPVAAAKGGFKHFMLKEIMEQARAVTDTIRGKVDFENADIVLENMPFTNLDLQDINRVVIVACGTSWYAGQIGKFLIENFARIPVEVDYGSEFRYRQPLLDNHTLLVSISQSGETADTLAAMEEGKTKGTRQITICNTIGSQTTRLADGVIYTHAGPEIGVASTKTFTTQLVALDLLAIYLGRARGTISRERMRSLVNDIARLPNLVSETLEMEQPYEELAHLYFKCSDFLYLGRGINYPIALEGALKLKEIGYIHAEGYPAGEMKHGPIALIDENMPVVVIATRDDVYEKMISNIEQVKAREGIVIAVGNKGDTVLQEKADHFIGVPECSYMLTPILTVIPLQLLAYYIAVRRGCDVDQPRNLAKSVTVE